MCRVREQVKMAGNNNRQVSLVPFLEHTLKWLVYLQKKARISPSRHKRQRTVMTPSLLLCYRASKLVGISGSTLAIVHLQSELHLLDFWWRKEHLRLYRQYLRTLYDIFLDNVEKCCPNNYIGQCIADWLKVRI